jgi:lipid-binding SYLF domain-containing protein
MTDDTRDLVIELRGDVATLKEIVQSLRATVLLLEQQRAVDAAQRSMLMWLGAAVIAAAGGVGAVTAKLAGWVTITVLK